MTPRKPRKMPKNQRAYPKKGKPRFTDVQQPEAGELIAASTRGDIDAPHIAHIGVDTNCNAVSVRVKADELRKWRALRNPPTSTGEQ